MPSLPSLLTALKGPGALRLMLALIVFVHHFSRLAIGTAAVYVFFVLSGYWIWRMWTVKYRHAESPYLTFLTSRLWRLLPVFWAVNLVTLAGHALVSPKLVNFMQTAEPWALARFVFSNLLILGYGSQPLLPIGPAWSLDIELQFYLVAPLFVLLLSRAPSLVLAAAAAAAMAFAMFETGRSLPLYLVFFLLGMRLCQSGWLPSQRSVSVGLWAALAIVAVFWIHPALRPVLMGGATPSALHEAWSPLLNLALAALVVPYAIASTRRRGGAHDGLYADLAYIVYLLHWIAVVVLATYAGNVAPMQRLPYIVLCFVLVMGVSYLIWRFVDRPFNRLRAEFVEHRIEEAKASQAAHHAPGGTAPTPGH